MTKSDRKIFYSSVFLYICSFSKEKTQFRAKRAPGERYNLHFYELGYFGNQSVRMGIACYHFGVSVHGEAELSRSNSSSGKNGDFGAVGR